MDTELSDLELLRKIVAMLQGEHVMAFSDHDEWFRIVEHAKFEEAFSIAFLAVRREEIQPATLAFIIEAIRSAAYFHNDYEHLRRKQPASGVSDHDAG